MHIAFHSVMERSRVAELLVARLHGVSSCITLHMGVKHEIESKEETDSFSNALGRISEPEKRAKRERNRERGWRKLHNEALRLYPYTLEHKSTLWSSSLRTYSLVEISLM
jgi:hypothetical protein